MGSCKPSLHTLFFVLWSLSLVFLLLFFSSAADISDKVLSLPELKTKGNVPKTR